MATAADVTHPPVDDQDATYVNQSTDGQRQHDPRTDDPQLRETELNIAVIGNVGVGKSSFINAIRGLTADDDTAAEVDVVGTTEKNTVAYPHCSNCKLKFFEIPGVETKQFFSQTPEFRKDFIGRYDFFLLLSATKFTENEIRFGTEIARHHKNIFYVRTKVDQDISNDKKSHPGTHNEDGVLNKVQSDICSSLTTNGIRTQHMFFVDNYEAVKFDFNNLRTSLIREFPRSKREAMTMSMNLGENSNYEISVHNQKLVLFINNSDIQECLNTIRTDDVQGFRKFIQKKQNAWKAIELNVAVIGEPGVGKSSFINAIRGMAADEEGAAEVEVVARKNHTDSYPHPNNPKLVFWELPGVGANQSKQELYMYLETINFDRYDFFLLMSATRFTEHDVWLGNEIKTLCKNFYYVRTKIGQDMSSSRRAHPKEHNDDAKLKRMHTHVADFFKKNGSAAAKMFYIDSYETDKFEFKNLQKSLVRDFPEQKRSSMILSMCSASTSEMMIKLKSKEVSSRIWMTAVTSGAVAFIPLTGRCGKPTLCFDIALIHKFTTEYFRLFGLDEASLRRYARFTSCDPQRLINIVAQSFGPEYFTVHGIASEMHKLVLDEETEKTVAEIADSALSSKSSISHFIHLNESKMTFAGTFFALAYILNRMERAALEVAGYVAKHDAGNDDDI